jgi:hypothetical protein
MQEIEYRNLKPGTEITVVTAWTESESFEDIASGHFVETVIEEVFFEPKGEAAFLRIFARDGEGELRRVNYVLEDGQIKSAGVVVPLAAVLQDTLFGYSRRAAFAEMERAFYHHG